MSCTYALSLSLVEFGPQQVKFVQRLLLALLHLLEKSLLVVDDLISLLLVLLDDVSVVSLTLNLEFVVFFLEVNRVLLVQLNLLVVAKLNSLQVLHHWLLGDIVSGGQLVVVVFSLVLNVEDGSLWSKKLVSKQLFEVIVSIIQL